MTTSNNDNLWVQLDKFPKSTNLQWCFLCLAKINKNNMLAVADGDIYNYNLQTQKWSLIKRIETIDSCSLNWNVYAAALCNNQLYLSDDDGALITINVVNKTHIGCYSHGFMINDEYHIIGGEYNNKHLKWNSKSNKWVTIQEFSEFESQHLSVNPVVYLKSKQKILMFGGYRSDMEKYFDTIYEYDIQQNIWNKTNIKMPKPCCVGIPV
eukprot:224741_1